MPTQSRLIEAAKAIDQSGKSITMSVRRNGIRMYMLQVGSDGVVKQTESFTPWGAIEQASVNPLLAVMRDLINQMQDLRESEL